MKSRKLFYKKFCKEKYSFLKTILSKPRWYMISMRETILFSKYLFQQRYRYVNQPWGIFHLSWVVNHYVWPTHSNNISILHFISVTQDVLQSTFKCTHFGFAPGYFIGQTLRNSLRRSSSRRSTALMALRTRLVSRSAACRLRHDLGSTMLCFVVFRYVCWVACPAWQLC